MRILEQKPVAALLRRLGIHPVQYAALLDFFGKLSDRQEFQAGRAEVSRNIAVGMFAVFMALGNLAAVFVAHPALRPFVTFNYAVTGLILFMTLVTEAISTFLNPIEISVLAHQPIRERDYFAAKITHLAAVVAWIVLPLNLVPALAGLAVQDSRWFFPVPYLLSVYFFGLFVALFLCAIMGVLFHLLTPARLRSLASWMQMVITLTLFGGVALAGTLVRLHFIVSASLASMNPLSWFVAVAMAGQGPRYLSFGGVQITVMLICAVFLVFGVRALSSGYMTKVHLLLRSGPKPRRWSKAPLGPFVRLVTGSPSGRAAFSFMYAMARTDWHFRASSMPVLIQFAILPLFGIARGLGPTPFAAVRPTGVHLLPHLAGLAGLSVCTMLTSSDQHKAAWIFLTAPLESIRSFVRGIFWALWVPLSMVGLLLLPLYIYDWGLRDAVLFFMYSLAVGAFYVSVELFLVDGLPFSNPPKRSGGFLTAPLVLGALIAAGIIVVLQWLFIFQDRFVTLGASLVFAGLAYLIAQISLRGVEVNVLHNLHVIASGRTAMFKELD
jgi:hypothetical protein